MAVVYPLNIPQTLPWKVRNFPDNVYNFNPTDNLTQLMNIALGAAGTGQIDLIFTAARINQENLEFSDLDNILGVLLNTRRLVTEMYNTVNNPFTDQLSISNWEDVISKDSAYRERLNGVSSSHLQGATPLGLRNIANATNSLENKIIEVWNTTTSGVTISGTNYYTRGFGKNETLVIPLVPNDLSFNNDLQRDTLQSLYNLQPAGNIVTISSGINPYNSFSYIVTSGNSEFFYLNRQVIANGVNNPSYTDNVANTTVSSRYFLRNNISVEAPQFAHLITEESITDVTLNITAANVIPLSSLSSTGELPGYNTTLPIGNPSLPITATVYGNV
jgi:hypothetical protein